LKDIFFGVPVQLGRGGLEKIIEYELDESEKSALRESADAVKQTTDAMKVLLGI
jgi:malate dehydrogenase